MIQKKKKKKRDNFDETEQKNQKTTPEQVNWKTNQISISKAHRNIM